MPPINYVAVLITSVIIFLLGGLWYSPLMFANKWMELQGKTRDELMASGGAGPLLYVQVFVCGFLTSLCMDALLKRFDSHFVVSGVKVAFLCWLGFAAATSFGTALFSFKPKALWAIDTGFNLVAFLVAGIFLAGWG